MKTRNKRIYEGKTKALRVLNIKPSTFHTLYSGGKTKKLQKLLEQALVLRTKDANERTQEEMKEDFNINFEAICIHLLMNHKMKMLVLDLVHYRVVRQYGLSGNLLKTSENRPQRFPAGFRFCTETPSAIEKGKHQLNVNNTWYLDLCMTVMCIEVINQCKL